MKIFLSKKAVTKKEDFKIIGDCETIENVLELLKKQIKNFNIQEWNMHILEDGFYIEPRK